MAVALKSKAFASQVDLTAFAANVANNVTTIIQVIYNQDGQYILFYV